MQTLHCQAYGEECGAEEEIWSSLQALTEANTNDS